MVKLWALVKKMRLRECSMYEWKKEKMCVWFCDREENTLLRNLTRKEVTEGHNLSENAVSRR